MKLKKTRFKWTDILFGVFVLLLLIPQTRQPIQVAVNKAKLWVWSPSITTEEESVIVPSFAYSTRNLEGKQVVHQVGDGEITFISFWATWCAPCVAELPSINALYQDYGGQVNFMLLTREHAEVVNAFLEKRDMDLPVFVPLVKAPPQLKSSSLPTNYLIDTDGTILIEETGAANWNSKKVRALLDGLLEKKNQSAVN